MGDHRRGSWRRASVAVSVGAALLPIVVAPLRAIRRGWLPTWDLAYPALRALDVFTEHSPLLGDRSMASGYRGITVSHPGPLEAQALAVWVRLFGPSAGTALGTACVNAVCVAAVAWLAGRRGGVTATTLAMATMASLAWSMGSEMLFDPWPEHAVLFPFALFLVAAWSTADGDLVALPVLVVAGSYVLQTHLSYAVLVPGVGVVSVAALAWRLRTRPGSPGVRPGLRRWGGLAAGLGALCWALPVYEQLSRPPGNMRSLIETAGTAPSSLSWSVAVRLTAGTVALPPWWLPPSFRSPAVDTVGRGVPLWLGVLGLAALVGAAGLALVRAARDGRWTTAAGTGGALVLVPLALVTITNAPIGIGIVIDYCRFLWVIAAFAGLVLALAARDEVRRRRPTPPGGGLLVPVVAAMGAVIAGGAALPYAPASARTSGWSVDTTRALADEVVAAVEAVEGGRGPVVVDMSPPFGSAGWIGPGLLVELQEAGLPFRVDDPVLERQLGGWRAFDGTHAAARLTVVAGTMQRPPTRPTATARPVAHADGLTPAQQDERDRLHGELLTALSRTHGLRFRNELPPSAQVPGMTGALERMLARLEPLADDPAALLASPVLAQMVYGVDEIAGGIDDVVDTGRIPADDLVRYAKLEIWRRERAVTVYLDDRVDRPGGRSPVRSGRTSGP